MITVLYTCKGCDLVEAKTFVRTRKPGESILAWMEEIRDAVGNDHSIRSPTCKAQACDLKIPVHDETKGIGFER